jgi:DNA-binding Lrp family transcriptional regulator
LTTSPKGAKIEAILSFFSEMTNLTSRQRNFLDRLLDLYRRERQPIHYLRLAEKVGVAATTAYEMLRTLEHKGYVASTYLLGRRHPGPGRSMVAFYPTVTAKDSPTEEKPFDMKEWLGVKERILSAITGGRTPNEDLVRELLARISEQDSPLVYYAEFMTALLLTMKEQILTRFKEHALVRMIMSDEPVEAGFLPGLALGMSLAQRANRRWRETLLGCAKECQRHLQRIDEEGRRRLMEFLREVLVALQA